MAGLDNNKGGTMNKKMLPEASLKERLLTTIARPAAGLYRAGAGTLLLAAVPHAASALNLYDGTYVGNNLEINLTTTLSYTGAIRVNDPSAILEPQEDGDANFQHGVV